MSRQHILSETGPFRKSLLATGVLVPFPPLGRGPAIEEACEHYRHALRFRPDDPEALFGFGAALLMLFRCEEALCPLQRAAALHPSTLSRS